jgi:hypothetical protein
MRLDILGYFALEVLAILYLVQAGGEALMYS